ncbi:hypothetical protein BJ508DRAFT_410337 [Ascobolus immersus RN42]|uniref:Uncharacterized protein n=1 Tax=Ascobolus immersus RN42 TaxID=1160509 RepID=A0A3N4IQ71_ASCIM|nr:hypothetical protein BJ508DRAFT_410337 [Ascobolus immersus RN42]
MPNPIPPPKSSIFNQSATSPYPVVQAITTTDASKHRGDWGLKRNLPLKTKVKHIGYTELDTMEHYTPFSTAENEVLLVKKWQEMDIPLAKQSQNSFAMGDFSGRHSITAVSGAPFISAFELEMLEDQAKTNGKELGFLEKKRANWDFSGPYLGKMTPGRLKEWMELRSNDRTMRDFLFFSAQRLQQYAKENKEDYTLENSPSFRPREKESSPAQVLASLKAKYSGKVPKEYQSFEDMPEYKKAEEIAQAKRTFLKDLEGKDTLNHQIFQYLRANTDILQLLVNAYFDIPTIPTGRTHPSAGLHYARSLSYMEYKPGVGGDISNKSLPGRILYSRRGGTQTGVAGIGGVVARCDSAPSMTNSRLKNVDDVEKIEHFTPGPGEAYIDGDGAIQLGVSVLAASPTDTVETVGVRRSLRHQQALDNQTKAYSANFARGDDLLSSVRDFSETVTGTPRIRPFFPAARRI